MGNGKSSSRGREYQRREEMARNISYVTGSQLLSLKRQLQPSIAIVDVRYDDLISPLSLSGIEFIAVVVVELNVD